MNTIAAQPFIKTFPCVSCGAKLSFAPGTATLRCTYCGAANEIPADESGVEELDLEQWLKSLQGTAEYENEERVRCGKCGAEEIIDHCARNLAPYKVPRRIEFCERI